MISLPQPASIADAATPMVATEADQGSRKKRKRSAASSVGDPHRSTKTAAPTTCCSRVTQDLRIAVSHLFSACQPPVQMPDLPAARNAEQPPTLDDLLRVHHTDSSAAGTDGRAAGTLPRDVCLRLIRYLEAVATYAASSSRGKPQLSDSSEAAGPDADPLAQPQSGELASALSLECSHGIFWPESHTVCISHTLTKHVSSRKISAT